MRNEARGRVSGFIFLLLLFTTPVLFVLNDHIGVESTNLRHIENSINSTSSHAMITANDAIWNQTFGGAGVDICYSLVEVETGGFALAGMTNSFFGEWKTWLIRLGPNGQHLWDKTYNFSLGYNCRTFIECNDGGFLFAGEINMNSLNYTALLKTDSSGTLKWNKTFGVNHWPGRIAVVKCNSEGYAFLSTIQLGLSEYLWLVRIDGDGNPLWNQTYDAGGSVYASSMLEVSDGGFLLVSLLENSMDVWIVRTDASGTAVWDVINRSYGTPQECWSVVELRGGAFDGFFVVAGYYGSTALRALWLFAVSPEGTKWWTQSFEFVNDKYSIALISASWGGFALVGSTSRYGADKVDMWLVRTDEGGNLRWYRILGGLENDWGVSIIEVNNNEFAIAGITESYDVNQVDIWFLRIADLPLWWVSELLDVVMYRGMVLSYALEADGVFGINTWGINDTEHFAIDNQGVITNTRVLDEGEYGLQIDVSDTQGNVLSGTIRVTVLPGPLPPLPPFGLVQILVFIVVLDIIMVVFLILFIRFKRHLFL